MDTKTSQLTIGLKYPNDRFKGYVLLSLNGQPFVPEFTRCQDNAMKYCQACMEFMRRMNTPHAWRE